MASHGWHISGVNGQHAGATVCHSEISFTFLECVFTDVSPTSSSRVVGENVTTTLGSGSENSSTNGRRAEWSPPKKASRVIARSPMGTHTLDYKSERNCCRVVSLS